MLIDTDDIRPTRKQLSPTTAELLQDRDGSLPVWVRAPRKGHEHYSGLTRPKLYHLAALGVIQTKSLREPGRVRGVRLFNLRSILEFIERA